MSQDDPSAESPRAPTGSGLDTRALGRGVLSVGGAKALFVLLGFAVTWAVPRLLGSPESFGRWTAVATALAILTNTLTNAQNQTVSKLTSENEAGAPWVVRRASLFALGTGVVCAGAFAAASPLLSGLVFGDPSLTPLFLIASLVLVAVPIYATGIGALNGQRRFAAQARLDAGFSVGRTVGLVGGAALGLGALGVVSGYTAALLGVAALAVALVGVGRAGGGPTLRTLLGLFVPIAVYTLASNGVLQLDVEILKAVLAAMLRADGLAATEAADLASAHVGLYRAPQSLAFVPYQLSITLTLVVFPLVSKATGTGDLEAARTATRGALRFAVLWLVLCEAPLAGGGERVLDLIFPASFVAGADALPVLALSQVVFAIFALTCTMLTGTGRAWHAFAAALAGLFVVVATTIAGLYVVGPEGPVRVVAALGALAGALVGLVASLAFVREALGPVIPWSSFLRALLAGTAGYAVARVVPLEDSLGAIAALGAGALAVLAVLGLLGELAFLRPRR